MSDERASRHPRPAIVWPRLARCESVIENADLSATSCAGLLSFQPGDLQARCSICRAWCGAGVASYLDQPPCSRCVAETAMDPEQIAGLRSRGFELRRVDQLSYEELNRPPHKPEQPSCWFDRVISSIRDQGVLLPLLVSRESGTGLQLIDGNHRAWGAVQLQVAAPVQIFHPVCGRCSEEGFREAAMRRTASLGWRY